MTQAVKSRKPKWTEMTFCTLREGPGDGVELPVSPTMRNLIHKGERYFRMSGWTTTDNDDAVGGNFLWAGWTPKRRDEGAATADQCECTYDQAPIAGVCGWKKPEEGVERCDLCEVFPGDLEAAFALAQHLGRKAWFINNTTSKPEVLEVTPEVLAAPEGVYVIHGHSDPWVGDKDQVPYPDWDDPDDE